MQSEVILGEMWAVYQQAKAHEHTHGAKLYSVHWNLKKKKKVEQRIVV